MATGARYDTIILGPAGRPFAGATVSVYTTVGDGVSTGILANIFSDQNLTVPQANPFLGDGNGNAGFWVALGVYVLTISGTGVTTQSYVFSAGGVGSVIIPNPAGPQTITGQSLTLTSSAQLNVQGDAVIQRLSLGTLGSPQLTKSTFPATSGFAEINTGLRTLSSVQVEAGSVLIDNNASYLMLRNGNAGAGTTGFRAFLQAGDTVSGNPAWLADNVFTLPDLAQGGAVGASGYLAGSTAAQWNAAIGHIMFADSNPGVFLDSQIAANQSIILPTAANAYSWKSGAFTNSIISAAISATTVLTLPAITGTIVPVVASVNLLAQTAAIGTTTLLAVGAAGQYLLSWNSKVTTVAGVSSALGALTIVYTDPDGVVQSIAVAPAFLATGVLATNGQGTTNTTATLLLGVPLLLNCKAGTNITYAMAYASNAANIMAYNLHLKLESLG